MFGMERVFLLSFKNISTVERGYEKLTIIFTDGKSVSISLKNLELNFSDLEVRKVYTKDELIL